MLDAMEIIAFFNALRDTNYKNITKNRNSKITNLFMNMILVKDMNLTVLYEYDESMKSVYKMMLSNVLKN